MYKFLFLVSLFLTLTGCSQTIEDPANPKVNTEYKRSADIKAVIVAVDMKEAQLFIQGDGYGLNSEGNGIIQLDEKYYSAANFKKGQMLEIWVDEHVKLTEKSNLPVITDAAKISFYPLIEE